MRQMLIRLLPCGRRRFYSVQLQPQLFGDWSAIVEWGEVGEEGTVRIEAHGSRDVAEARAEHLLAARRRMGYLGPLDKP